MDAASSLVVEMRNISKRFGSFVAIHDASLDIGRGEIHALVGENGAGKSTLMNILYGMLPRSGGMIDFDGRPVSFANPREAISAGVGMVHQHFKLAPTFTVAENIILGSEPMRSVGRIDVKRAEAETKALSEAFELDLDPRAVVGSLPVGLRQRVEILKALYRKARVLILDEPTAVLTPQETRELFVNMRALAGQGHSIIFITHKLREVLAAADRISVMRQGRTVSAIKNEGVTAEEIARLMVGRPVLLRVTKQKAQPSAAPLLQVDNLTAMGDRGESPSAGSRLRSAAARSSNSPACRATARTSWSNALPGCACPAPERSPSPAGRSATRRQPTATSALLIFPLTATRSGSPSKAPSGRT